MRPAEDNAADHHEPARDLDGRHPLAKESDREEGTPKNDWRRIASCAAIAACNLCNLLLTRVHEVFYHVFDFTTQCCRRASLRLGCWWFVIRQTSQRAAYNEAYRVCRKPA